MKEVQVNSSHSGQELSKKKEKAIMISPSPFLTASAQLA